METVPFFSLVWSIEWPPQRDLQRAISVPTLNAWFSPKETALQCFFQATWRILMTPWWHYNFFENWSALGWIFNHIIWKSQILVARRITLYQVWEKCRLLSRSRTTSYLAVHEIQSVKLMPGIVCSKNKMKSDFHVMSVKPFNFHLWLDWLYCRKKYLLQTRLFLQ